MDIAEYLPGTQSRHKQKSPSGFNAEDSSDRFYAQLKEERRAVVDKDLSHGAVRLFFLLLKFSWLRTFNQNRAPGVITVSQHRLAEELCSGNRSIFRWKRELEAGRYVWTKKRPLPNAWPIVEYHICVLDPAPEGGPKPETGLWGPVGQTGTPSFSDWSDRESPQVPDLEPAKIHSEPGPGSPRRMPGLIVSPARGQNRHETGVQVPEKHPPRAHSEPGRRPNGARAVATSGELREITLEGKMTSEEGGSPPALDCLPPKPNKRPSGAVEEHPAPFFQGGKEPPKFIREMDRQLELIGAKIAALKAEAKNYKLTLAKDVVDAVTWLRSEADRIKAEDPEKAAGYLAEATAREKNPVNLVKGALLPHAAATLANLTRKKQDLETAIALKGGV